MRTLLTKTECTVGLDTGEVVTVGLRGADKGDRSMLHETLCEAG